MTRSYIAPAKVVLTHEELPNTRVAGGVYFRTDLNIILYAVTQHTLS